MKRTRDTVINKTNEIDYFSYLPFETLQLIFSYCPLIISHYLAYRSICIRLNLFICDHIDWIDYINETPLKFQFPDLIHYKQPDFNVNKYCFHLFMIYLRYTAPKPPIYNHNISWYHSVKLCKEGVLYRKRIRIQKYTLKHNIIPKQPLPRTCKSVK